MEGNTGGDQAVATTAPAEPPVVSATSAPEAPKPAEQPSAPSAPALGQPSERTTEQFEKLKESNRKLFEANRLLQEELAKKARSEQTFAPIQQPEVPLAPAPSMEQFTVVDPTSGERYVDERKLAAALADVTQRATRAESAVQGYIRRQDVLDEERQTREAYASHPELNPSSDKFDAEVSRRTRALLLDSMMNPQDYGGTQMSFKDAAAEAKKQT